MHSGRQAIADDFVESVQGLLSYFSACQINSMESRFFLPSSENNLMTMKVWLRTALLWAIATFLTHLVQTGVSGRDSVSSLRAHPLSEREHATGTTWSMSDSCSPKCLGGESTK